MILGIDRKVGREESIQGLVSRPASYSKCDDQLLKGFSLSLTG